MKRFIIVCLCLSLLSLLIIPAFAVDSNINFSVNISGSFHITEFTVDGFSSSFASDGFSVSVSSDVVHSASGVITSTGGSNYGMVLSYGASRLSTDSSNPTVLPDSAALTISKSDFSSIMTYYFIVESPPDPMVDLGVTGGVSSFIAWTGNVLSNLVMSPAVLVLVGLSIGMLAILPWGISKIKSLIKGY